MAKIVDQKTSLPPSQTTEFALRLIIIHQTDLTLFGHQVCGHEINEKQNQVFKAVA